MPDLVSALEGLFQYPVDEIEVDAKGANWISPILSSAPLSTPSSTTSSVESTLLDILTDGEERVPMEHYTVHSPALSSFGEEPIRDQAVLTAYAGERLGYLLERLITGDLEKGDGRVPSGVDWALGKEILKTMITGQATIATLTSVEIQRRLERSGVVPKGSEAVRKTIVTICSVLEQIGLLCRFERWGITFYELAHDLLAAEIVTWMSQEEMEIRKAHEALAQAMVRWRRNGQLIQANELALIYEQRWGLQQLSLPELDLLFQSALIAGEQVAYWAKRAQAGGVPVNRRLFANLQNEDFRVRAIAVRLLGQLGKQRFIEPIIEMLQDDYPQVRVAAIYALERLQPDGDWRKYLRYECYVPAGTFVMGKNAGKSDERPAHQVYLDAFYISKYPVTNADYKRYADDTYRSFAFPVGEEDHPVVNVSWQDACDYAAWATMRLPTEAEWEKAASWSGEAEEPTTRHGYLRRWLEDVRPEKRRYPWGNVFDPNRCNARESYLFRTTPVGKYSPEGDSPCGCADMAGNVQEWVSDWYGPYPSGEQSCSTGPKIGTSKVLRGGSFYSPRESVQTTRRASATPSLRYYSIGFRCVIPLPSSEKP